MNYLILTTSGRKGFDFEFKIFGKPVGAGTDAMILKGGEASAG